MKIKEKQKQKKKESGLYRREKQRIWNHTRGGKIVMNPYELPR